MSCYLYINGLSPLHLYEPVCTFPRQVVYLVHVDPEVCPPLCDGQREKGVQRYRAERYHRVLRSELISLDRIKAIYKTNKVKLKMKVRAKFST